MTGPNTCDRCCCTLDGRRFRIYRLNDTIEYWCSSCYLESHGHKRKEEIAH